MKLMSTGELLSKIRETEGVTREAAIAISCGWSTHYLCWFNSRLEHSMDGNFWDRTSLKKFKEMYPDTLGPVWELRLE